MSERDIFLAAIDLPDAAARAAYLDRACAGNAGLRARVEALLASHAGAGSFLGTPLVPPADPEFAATRDLESATPRTAGAATACYGPGGATSTFGGPPVPREGAAPTELGEVIAGRYTLVGVIGEGGMGSVYLAEQTEPVKRPVALKLIKGGMDSKSVLARFDAERQALALMEHPNIARIYDGGVTEKGQPFFVMELVQGVPLTEYCDSKRLPVDARLELFVAVCQAVHHAHQKGIIHRDLKPGNVLVSEVDGKPTPKVIDFGVAKATELKLTDLSLADAGAIVGTPAYMSPEQADPTSMDIDTRTDVYALGVILYELLTGAPPIDAKQLKRGAVLEMLRMVREVEPPRPSTKLSAAEALPNIAANRGTEPTKLTRLLRGELDWVVMKALEKDRDRRYGSALGFAEDVRRYLSDEVVEARAPSRAYRLRKFVTRNRAQVAAAAVVFLALVGGVVGTTVGMVRAEKAQVEEARQRGEAEKARDGEKGQRQKAEVLAETNGRLADDNAKLAAEEREAKTKAVEATREVERQLARVRAIMYTNQMTKAAALVDKQPQQALDLLFDPEHCPPDMRDAAWHMSVRQCQRHVVSYTALPPLGTGNPLATTEDGTRLAMRADRTDGAVRRRISTVTVHELPSGKVLATLPDFVNQTGQEKVRFSPDGTRLLTAAAENYKLEPPYTPPAEYLFQLWDLATGKPVVTFKGRTPDADRAVFAPTAALLVVPDGDGTRAVDLATGKVRYSTTGAADALAFSPDGKTLATGGPDGVVRLWDAATGAPGATFTMAANDDPEYLAARKEAERTSQGRRKLDGVASLDFSPDGTALVASNLNWLAEVWDVARGERRATVRGAKGGLYRARFHGDGKSLVGNEGLWDIATGQQLAALPLGSAGFADKDRKRLVSATWRSVTVYDPTAKVTERAAHTIGGLKMGSSPLVHGRDGLVAVGCDNRIEVWDTAAGRMRPPLVGHKNQVAALAVSPDGRVLASSARQPRKIGQPRKISSDVGPMPEPVRDDVILWDLETGTRLGALPINEVEVPDLAFSPDGKTVATICWPDGVDRNHSTVSVGLWDVAARARRDGFEFPASEVLPIGLAHVAFNPADGTLAAGAGNVLTVWNPVTRTRRDLPAILGSGLLVGRFQFSPDGRTLAVGQPDVRTGPGGGSGSLSFVRAATGEVAGALSGRGDVAVFSPDGKTVMTHAQNKVYFWNAHTLQLLAALDVGGTGGAYHRFALSPDGRVLGGVASAFDSDRVTLKLWDIGPVPTVARLKGLPRFGQDNKTLVLKNGSDYQFWDLEASRVRATVYPGRSIMSVTALSPDCKRLAVAGGQGFGASADQTVDVFDTHTGAKVGTVKPVVNARQISGPGMAFSPDGRTLALGVVSRPAGVPERPAPDAPPRDVPVTVTLWNLADGRPGEPIHLQLRADDAVFGGGEVRLAYSPDGRALAVGGASGIVVFDPRDPAKRVGIPVPKEFATGRGGAYPMAFTPDSTRLAVRYSHGSGKQAEVMWDRATGARVEGPVPPVLPPSDPYASRSPDGRYEIRLPGATSPGVELIDRTIIPPVLRAPLLTGAP